jgi:hypothetical protein
VALIAWLAYYFNTPNWWQIWTHLFLYGFLVIDLIERRRLGIGTTSTSVSVAGRVGRMRVHLPVLLLLLFLSVLIPHTNRHLIKYTVEFMYPHWIADSQGAKVVSGVLMPRDVANAFEANAERLKKMYMQADGKLVYLTFNTGFMPAMSRRFQPAPYRDMFGEIPGDIAFDGAIRELLRRRPEVILVDAPEGVLAVSGPRKEYQARLRAAISRAYRIEGTEDGWQIWRPSS